MPIPSTMTAPQLPPPTSASRLLRAVAALALLALAACSGTEATEPQVAMAVAASGRHPAMAIVDRLDEGSAGATPDVVGVTYERASAVLVDAGAVAVPVSVGEGERVTAQHPSAGEALPDDGQVVVWLGVPPAVEPPPEPEAEAAAIELAGAAAAEPLSTPAAPDPPIAVAAAPVVEAAQPAPAAVPAEAPVAEAAPGPSPSPAPPRSNIRTLDPTPAGTVLEGAASWYGPGFAGNRTACGDVFDPEQLTLASRELRCGTRVLLTGPGGTTVEATVTDWGPAEWTNRRFDLSAATFRALADPGTGVIQVRLEVLASE